MAPWTHDHRNRQHGAGIGDRVLAGRHDLTVVGKDSQRALLHIAVQNTLGTGFASALNMIAGR